MRRSWVRSWMSLLLVAPLLAVPAAAEPAGPATGDLSWMAGRWSAMQDGVLREEIWIDPRGGMMLGLHRDTKGDRVVLFEFLRIQQDEQGIVYIAQPEGKPGTPFRLVRSEPRRVVFENPDHDFPQRILYWLGEDGALRARIEGVRDGTPASAEWRWERTGD